MGKNTKFAVVAILLALLGLLGLVLINDYAQTRSAARLSLLLEKVNEGMPYPEVEKILGKPSRSFTKQADVREWGTVQDNKITERCNLHLFPYMGMPHRYILIYEDMETGTVRLVTWMNM